MGLIETLKSASRKISRSWIGIFIRDLPLNITLQICIVVAAALAISIVLTQLPKMANKPFNADAFFCAAYGSTALMVGLIAFVVYPFVTSAPFPIIILMALAASCLAVMGSVAFDNILRINDHPDMRASENTKEAFLSRAQFLHTVTGFIVGSVFVFFPMLCPFRQAPKQDDNDNKGVEAGSKT
jgi:hypothetical protein